MGKDDFIDAFHVGLLQIEIKNGYSKQTLQIDDGGEFIFIKLSNFNKKLAIAIKYIIPYMPKKTD